MAREAEKFLDQVRDLKGRVGTVLEVRDAGIFIQVDRGLEMLVGDEFVVCKPGKPGEPGRLIGLARMTSVSDLGVWARWIYRPHNRAASKGDVVLAADDSPVEGDD